MTWECAADEYNSKFYARPDEYVRFHYVENPRCFDVETSKNFCAELRKAGKTVVNVDFELWGHSHTLRGYRIVSVDGRSIQDVGGWGVTELTTTQGPAHHILRSHGGNIIGSKWGVLGITG